MEMDRRSFLKGAAAVGAISVAAGLTACTTGEGTSGQSSTSSGASGEFGTHTWDVPPAPITDIADTKDYDIVIVGAGLAGLSAAEAAARNGAKTVILEQSTEFQIRGVDVGHIGSKYHLRNGFNIDPQIPARMLHLWAHQTTNYKLINTWTTRSGKVFDYIEELVAKDGIVMVAAISPTAKYGWETLDERWRVFPDAVSFVTSPNATSLSDEGTSMRENLGGALFRSTESNGAEFIFNIHAEQLVGSAANGITGVIAMDEDGKYIQFNAKKGVILATGDISGNQEMIDTFAPICNRADGNVYTPAGGNHGDGILMTSWIGGAISKSPAAPMVHQFTFESFAFNLTSFTMCWLAVNRDGERYGAEMPFEPYLTNARMNTPGSIAWSIFDADYPKYTQEQHPGNYQDLLAGIEDTIETLVADGKLYRADTLDDLASQLGIPADTFKATVEHYNSMLDKGEDTQFTVPPRFLSQVKTAPFYATPNVCSVLTIPFGVHVNADSQVCTKDDVPIDGLFAVGNVQGDFFGGDYPVHFPGISQGRCITFGQLVGEALAKDTVITKTV